MAGPRRWVKLWSEWAQSAKWMPRGNESFGVFVRLLLLGADTQGWVPWELVDAIEVGRKNTRALVKTGALTEEPDGIRIADFFEHQSTDEEIESRSRVARDAANVRWNGHKSNASRMHEAMPKAMPGLCDAGSRMQEAGSRKQEAGSETLSLDMRSSASPPTEGMARVAQILTETCPRWFDPPTPESNKLRSRGFWAGFQKRAGTLSDETWETIGAYVEAGGCAYTMKVKPPVSIEFFASAALPRLLESAQAWDRAHRPDLAEVYRDLTGELYPGLIEHLRTKTGHGK